MRVHLPSKGHILTPALKAIQWTRAEHLLQWHVENGHRNISSQTRKSSPSRSSTNTKTTRFNLKHPVR